MHVETSCSSGRMGSISFINPPLPSSSLLSMKGWAPMFKEYQTHHEEQNSSMFVIHPQPSDTPLLGASSALDPISSIKQPRIRPITLLSHGASVTSAASLLILWLGDEDKETPDNSFAKPDYHAVAKTLCSEGKTCSFTMSAGMLLSHSAILDLPYVDMVFTCKHVDIPALIDVMPLKANTTNHLRSFLQYEKCPPLIPQSLHEHPPPNQRECMHPMESITFTAKWLQSRVY